MVGRVNGFDYKTALGEIKKLEDEKYCSGCELMMLTFYYDKLDEVVNSVRNSGVRPVVIHCEKEVGTLISDAAVLDSCGKHDEAEEKYAEAVRCFRLNCMTAEKLSVSRMVLHLWGGYSSDRNIGYNIARFPELERIAENSGARLLVENIPSNTNDPASNWHKLLPNLGKAGLIFDTRFGKLHEQSEEILTDNELTSRIEHIHVSDYTGGYKNFAALRPILHPRDGVIDFETVSRLILDTGYRGYVTLESPVMSDSGLDIPKIKDTLTYLNKIFNK